MTDKKTIKDLNRLIRPNERRKLNAAPARGSILGGTGIAGGATDAPLDEVVELLYVRHYGGGVSNVVYSYNPDGSAPVLEYDLTTAYAYSLGVHGTDFYSSHNDNGAVIKNNSIIIPSIGITSVVGTNSTNLVVLGTDSNDYNIKVYDFDGNLESTIPITTAGQSSTHFAVNDVAAAYYNTNNFVGAIYTIIKYDGTLLYRDNPSSYLYEDGIFANKSAFYFMRYGATDFEIYIHNNAGTQIGVYLINYSALSSLLGGEPYNIGATSTHFFIIGDSTTQPKVLIYEHTVVLDGAGLATSATLGALLHTVNTPQGDNTAHSTWQSCATDSSIWDQI